MRGIFSASSLSLFSIPLLLSCTVNTSVSKKYTGSLITKGIGLSCDEIYMTKEKNEKVQESTFVYGQNLVLNFNGVKGLKKKNGKVHPGMGLFVIGSKQDTLMSYEDLYADQTEGFDLDPLLLSATVTIATPLVSNESYDLHVYIWDKNGSGTFYAKQSFETKSNEHIRITTKNTSYDEVYLYNNKLKQIVTDGKVRHHDTIYVIFEGIKGFTEVDGLVFPGMSMKASSSDNKVYLDKKDLYLDESADADMFSNQIMAYLVVNEATINNPLNYKIDIWDKNGKSQITARIALEVVD